MLLSGIDAFQFAMIWAVIGVIYKDHGRSPAFAVVCCLMFLFVAVLRFIQAA